VSGDGNGKLVVLIHIQQCALTDLSVCADSAVERCATTVDGEKGDWQERECVRPTDAWWCKSGRQRAGVERGVGNDTRCDQLGVSRQKWD
jgi:hypothetical protein